MIIWPLQPPLRTASIRLLSKYALHGSGDYPTICPGINHGRCLTFGRIAGTQAAGGSTDEIDDYDLKMS